MATTERPLGHMDAIALFDRTILTRAARDSLIKLHPLRLMPFGRWLTFHGLPAFINSGGKVYH